MNVLICIAHPDDEVLGMGGTIAKLVQDGHQVSVCVFTVSYAPYWDDAYREDVVREQAEVDKSLGIFKRFNLGFRAAELSIVSPMEIFDKLKPVMKEVSPQRVYSTSKEDFHADHRVVFDAALTISRPINGNKIDFLTFETPSSSEWGCEAKPLNYYSDISGHLENKISALACYKRESKKDQHPRSLESVRRLAILRGEQIGVQAAEAFKAIRIYS